jgi:hypothetical protein
MCNAAYSGDAATVSQLLQSGKGNAKEVRTPLITFKFTPRNLVHYVAG